jgi:hypothetical protein
VSKDWQDFNEEMTVACQAIGPINGTASAGSQMKVVHVLADDDEEEEVCLL